MKTKKTLLFILMYLPLVVVLIALQYLPEKIPAHYGFDGQVDRWGSKYEALLLPITSLLLGYFKLGMAKFASKQEKHGNNNEKIMLITGFLVLLLLNAMNGYFIYTAFYNIENLSEVPLDVSRLFSGFLGVFMIVLGNVMPKLRKNSMIGLRTTWSMKNDTAWKKSQRIGGISLIIGGIMIIGICTAIKGIPCLVSVLGVVTILTVIDVFLTYKIAKKN